MKTIAKLLEKERARQARSRKNSSQRAVSPRPNKDQVVSSSMRQLMLERRQKKIEEELARNPKPVVQPPKKRSTRSILNYGKPVVKAVLKP